MTRGSTTVVMTKMTYSQFTTSTWQLPRSYSCSATSSQVGLRCKASLTKHKFWLNKLCLSANSCQSSFKAVFSRISAVTTNVKMRWKVPDFTTSTLLSCGSKQLRAVAMTSLKALNQAKLPRCTEPPLKRKSWAMLSTKQLTSTI